jgi:molecular chaperone DnaK (HSP70)
MEQQLARGTVIDLGNSSIRYGKWQGQIPHIESTFHCALELNAEGQVSIGAQIHEGTCILIILIFFLKKKSHKIINQLKDSRPESVAAGLRSLSDPSLIIHLARNETVFDVSGEDLVQLFLAHAKLGPDTVVAVPTMFSLAEIAVVERAAWKAGASGSSNVVRSMTCVAAYLDKVFEEPEGSTVMVFDFGAGALSVGLVRLAAAGSGEEPKVVSVSGSCSLGGMDIDASVADYLARAFLRTTGRDVSGNARAMLRLRRAAEIAKRTLSAAHGTPITIDNVIEGIPFNTSLNREAFEIQCASLFHASLGPVAAVLASAELRPEQVDRYVMLGGSSAISKVKEIVRGFFGGREPTPIPYPNEAVSRGACALALSKSQRLQQQQQQQQQQQSFLHPVVHDLMPFAICVEGEGGAMVPVIKPNSAIPVQKSRILSAREDFQQGITIRLFEVISEAKANLIWAAELLIPRARAGMVEVEFTVSLETLSSIQVSLHVGDRKENYSIDLRMPVHNLPERGWSPKVHKRHRN